MTFTPEFRRLLDQLTFLRGVETRQLTDAALEAQVRTLLSMDGVRQRVFLNENQVWHRGRPCSTEYPFDKLDQLTYPKSPSSFGRANEPGKPVLYASRNLGTVLSELGATTGQFVQVVATRVKPGHICKSEIIGEFQSIANAGLSLLGYDKSIELAESVIKEGGDLWLRTTMLDAFLADRFSTPSNHDYRLTSMVARLLFSSGSEAVMYPSVQHNGGMNVAVCASAFDAHFEVLWSDVVEVTYLGYGQYLSRPIRTSTHIDVDGAITWSKEPTERTNISFSLKAGIRPR